MTRFRNIIQCLVVASLLAGTLDSIAQHTDVPSGIVVFDPLFWKDQLKLDDKQCRKIKEINREYYTKLLVVAQDERIQRNLQSFAAESLRQRSQEIWETFQPKQRKRWKRLWEENYMSDHSGNS
jgi:hypothetical protein